MSALKSSVETTEEMQTTTGKQDIRANQLQENQVRVPVKIVNCWKEDDDIVYLMSFDKVTSTQAKQLYPQLTLEYLENKFNKFISSHPY